jgi:hypothetical protein
MCGGGPTALLRLHQAADNTGETVEAWSIRGEKNTVRRSGYRASAADSPVQSRVGLRL